MGSVILNTVTYNRNLVALGGINCAIYLSAIIYDHHNWADQNGWMILDAELIERITGLNHLEQAMAKCKLINQKILERPDPRYPSLVRLDTDSLDKVLEEA